jgi:hypothetical protein
MIVSVTRGDLRAEFVMAEEAFALSPISARAAQPSEEDFAAISEAFMETSRGRWFLGEYAKRNRNADTRMVLDAVARIEDSLAAQRQATSDADTGLTEAALAEARSADAKLAEARLAEILSTIRSATEAAQAAAIAALDTVVPEQDLATVRKGARVLREIAWRLREIGNDGRICDLIDSQVGIIEAGAARFSSDVAKAALSEAFATIARRLAEFDAAEAAPPAAEAAAAEAPVSAAEAVPVQEVRATDRVAPVGEPAPVAAAAAPAESETPELADVSGEADAHDEAVLDMVAMEMGAPDPFEADDAEIVVEETPLAAAVAPEPVAERRETETAAMAPPVEIPPQAAIEPRPAPAMEISLGASIIASGLVRKPSTAANDPLAPIRRMSQAEKIAFFS